MSYLDLAEQLVSTLEGNRLVGYLDSVGKPTDGTGHTGPEVRVGRVITAEVAAHNLAVDLHIADNRLAERVNAVALARLTDHERATLISFVFNVGAGATWQIWKDLNAGDLSDIPHELRRFINGEIDGHEQVIEGLVHRREAEVAFWNTADLAQAAAVIAAAPVAAPSSSVTRSIPTPPTPEPAPALNKTSIVTKVVSTVAALGAGASQVHDIVAPHVSEAQVFQTASTLAVGVVILASVFALFVKAEQDKARKS